MVVSVVIVIGIIVAAYTLPLGTDEKVYVPSAHTPKSINLALNNKLTQRIIAMPGTYSGLVLYSDNENFLGSELNTIIEDKTKQISVSGNYVAPSFPSNSDNLMRLAIPTKHFAVTKPTHLFIHVTNLDKNDLSLKTSIENQQLYASGELTINNIKTSRDLALSLLQPIPLSDSFRQGVLAGVIFMLGLFLLQFIPRESYRWAGAIVLVTIITPLALAGYWFSNGPLGIADWDYYFSLHHSYRQIILQYNQLPFWNPYTCGGTAGLADPEFPLFTPTFMLELIFGVPKGIRLAIFLSTIVGTTGMLFLAKRLRLSLNSSLLAAITVAFSTVNLLEITEGHVNIFAAMWIPWIFWAWLGAYRKKSSGLLCGIFLALTFYQGGIYLLMYTALAFLLLPFLVSRPKAAIVATVKAGLWALGLAAIKLVPVLLWLKQFPDDAFASSAFTLPWITEILFGRHLHGSYLIPNQDSGWHEYGAYIGYLVFALVLIGASKLRRDRVIKALVIAAVLAILLSSLGPYLKPIFDYLWFFPRSNISRIILFAVIPIALLAGYGLNSIKQKTIKTLIIGFVAIDLMSLSYPLSQQAFVLPEVYPLISPAPSPLAFTALRYDMTGQGSRTTRAYAATRAGYGTLAYCSVLGPKPAVQTIHDEEDNEIISLSNKSASYHLVHWSPNKVAVNITTQNQTNVTLNTNYALGWTANGQKATNRAGRVSTAVTSSGPVTFRYYSPGSIPGLITTIITAIAAVIAVTKRPKIKPGAR
ncbi:MAG: hypothetical protein ABIH36_02590 [bacterium]